MEKLLRTTFFIFVVTSLLVSVHAAQRFVIIENQTQASCGNCYYADIVLDQLHEEYPDIFIPITYHARDIFYSYNPDENLDRIFFYPPHTDGEYYTPYAWIDGLIRGDSYYNSWWGLIDDRLNTESPLTITLSGNFNSETLTGALDLKITCESPITLPDLKLRIALTEDSVYYRAPNGTDWHNYTMRDMIPDADGQSISIDDGESIQLSQEFACPEPLRPDYCRLVAWVQSDDTMSLEILQSAAIMVRDLDMVGIDEPVDLPQTFDLSQNYPNPFNARTSISYSVKSEGMVELAVYDIAGREVITLVRGRQAPGVHQVVWDGTNHTGKSVVSGTYFYKLRIDNKTESRRMLLLK
jgi:hypothetical protein